MGIFGKIRFPHLKQATYNQFCKEVLGIIERHYNDSNFTVDNLCRKMLMSYPQLLRKMSPGFDKIPKQLIREVRLPKAVELLETTSYTIAEVAERTGFGDPSYFTRVFSKEFGMSPTGYREKYRMVRIHPK